MSCILVCGLRWVQGTLPELILNSNIYENFVKIKLFNLNSNFDQATQTKIKKKAFFMAKLISVVPNMMAPIWCHK